MEYLNTKKNFGPNECRSIDERNSIASDLNIMTIEDLVKDSDIYFVLNFLKDSAVVEHYGFSTEEIENGLRSLYKHITPNRNRSILESPLTELRLNLSSHNLLNLILTKVESSDGERVAGAARQTLLYLEIYRTKDSQMQ